MAIRLACVSTAKNTTKILQQMIADNEDIELVLHLGGTDAHYKASSLARMSKRAGVNGPLVRGAAVTHANMELIGSAEFKQSAAEFVDHMHRDSGMFKFKGHHVRATQDLLDYYHILTDVLATKLRENDVTHVLFFNVPHLSYDTALYHMARAMGLETLIVTQSLFPGKFFSMRRPQAYGSLRESADDAPPMTIEQGKELDLFYMSAVGQERGETGRITLRGLLQLFAHVLMKRPFSALNPVYWWKTISRMRKIYGGLPKWRDPFAQFFHDNSLAYFEHILQFEEADVDFGKRFVYFAMQMQPEMTTSSLGGKYVDQALAIEHLAALLPEDVMIYVKDNPKQRAAMRGPMFFHRLARIPNVQIVPSFTSTHALTDNSLFVATITGTVGWEAVRKGKRALIFGNAWYRDFPGVVRMKEGLTFDEIVTAPLIHEDLEKAAGRLLGALHDGVVDRHYTKLVDQFDEEDNAKAVSQTLAKLIRRERDVVFERE